MQSNVSTITNQATVLLTKRTTPLTLFDKSCPLVLLDSKFGILTFNLSVFAIKSNILMDNSSYKLLTVKPFFWGEGGKKCWKLQLAVVGPDLSIAFNTIFWLQCMDAGRHYAFGSNAAEEHQSYAFFTLLYRLHLLVGASVSWLETTVTTLLWTQCTLQRSSVLHTDTNPLSWGRMQPRQSVDTDGSGCWNSFGFQFLN